MQLYITDIFVKVLQFEDKFDKIQLTDLRIIKKRMILEMTHIASKSHVVNQRADTENLSVFLPPPLKQLTSVFLKNVQLIYIIFYNGYPSHVQFFWIFIEKIFLHSFYIFLEI